MSQELGSSRDKHTQARQRWRRAAGFTCITALVALVAACSPAGGDTPQPSATVAVKEGVDARAVSDDGSLVVDIPGASLSGSGTLTVTPAAHADSTAGFTVNLADGAELTGAATLTFDVPDVDPTMPAPLVTYADTPEGDRTPVEVVKFDGKTATVTTTHFSWWSVRTWDDLMDQFRGGLDRLYSAQAVGKQPVCDGESDVREAGYTITSDSGSRVMWCLGTGDTGTPALKVANARGYAVSAEHTPGLNLLTYEQGDLADDIVQWLRPAPSKQGNVVSIIAAGEEVTYEVSGRGDSGVMVKPAPAAYLFTASQYAIDTVAMVLDATGAKGVTREALEAGLDAQTCFAGFRTMTSTQIDNATEASTYLTDATGTAMGCMGPVIEQLGLGFWGVKAIEVLSWLSSGVRTVTDGLAGAADTLLDPNGYRIVVTSPDGPPASEPSASEGGTQVSFDHPSWGTSRLVVGQEPSPDGFTHYVLRVLDETDAVRWEYATDTLGEYGWQFADPAIDAQGNLFVTYNPGRYNGLIVLRPTATGMEDFDSLAALDAAEPYGRFYNAEPIDVDGDGVLEIRLTNNMCDPTCADGPFVEELYRWDGQQYAANS